MKNKMKFIYGGLIIVALAFVFFGSNLFSVLDGDVSCEIPVGGGDCTLEFVLDANREYASFFMDLNVAPVPDSNYSAYKSITHSSVSARLYEERTDRDPREETWETVYMYNIPEQDVFAIAVKTEATGTANSPSTGINSRSKIEINGVSTRYILDTIVTCPYSRSSDCRARYGGGTLSNVYYTIRDYRASDGDDDYSIANDVNLLGFNGKNAYESVNSDSVITGREVSPQFFQLEATTEGVANVRNDAFFIIPGNDIERGSTSSITAPQNVQYAVKPYIFTQNLGYSVGSKNVETIAGITKGNITTLEFSAQMNDYCGRNNNDGGVCVIPITFSSSTGGIITLTNEEKILRTFEELVVEGYDDCVNENGRITNVVSSNGITVTTCTIFETNYIQAPKTYGECLAQGGSTSLVEEVQVCEFDGLAFNQIATTYDDCVVKSGVLRQSVDVDGDEQITCTIDGSTFDAPEKRNFFQQIWDWFVGIFK